MVVVVCLDDSVRSLDRNGGTDGRPGRSEEGKDRESDRGSHLV